MIEAPRISLQEARTKTINNEAILVCAYPSEEKFAQNHLEGAISLAEFKERESSLSKEDSIIFY